MKYPGGKSGSGVYQRIINQMPVHDEYIEPFVGGGAVFLRKRPAAVNVLIDRDGAAVQKLASIVNAGGCCPGNGTPGPGNTWDGVDVHLVVGDGISYLQNRRWPRRSLVYVDPPYPVELRRRQRWMYRCELSTSDHVRLLGVVLKLPCMVMVSGYDGPPYGQALSSWRVVRYLTRTHQSTVEECLWCNFPEPVDLHDWRYFGCDYREREKVRNLAARWVARVDRLPAPVRRLVLEGLSRPTST